MRVLTGASSGYNIDEALAKADAIAWRGPYQADGTLCKQIIVTEQGLAALRGLGPVQRAKLIIEKCAHPDYKPYLAKYVQEARVGHIPHDLGRCFELHQNLLTSGTMLPDLKPQTNESTKVVLVR